MTTADWTTTMENSAAVITGDVEAHSDLFGGDLFGDELLDMYNSSVAGGADGVNDIPNGIPPIMMRNGDETPGVKEEVFSMENDGLGAFRPSTSINDLSSLLGGSDPLEATPQKASSANQEIGNGEPGSSGKKRGRVSSSPVVAITPAKKKKTAGGGKNTQGQVAQLGAPRGSPGNANKEDARAAAATVTAAGAPDQQVNANKVEENGNDNTPDPLTIATRVVSIEPTQVLSTSIRTSVPTAPVSAVVPKQATLVAQAAAAAPLMKVTANTLTTNQLLASQRTVKEPTMNSPKTEEAFKGVAQAAVTNLILNAGNASRIDGGNDCETDASGKPIDTSSAHVAALTSNNWVAACAASISDAPPGTAAAAQAAALAAASDPAAAKAARARRATLTADERARQNRDRNREHARNTRLRKKAYVEELKRTLTELVNQRDATELERRHEKQRDIEVREVRYRVMEEFLKLRARGSETNLLARWVAILEDGFTLTLPRTEYRIMLQNQLGDSLSQVLKGATECLDDASKLSAFVNSIGLGNVSQIPNNAAVRMTYHCDRKKFMMDDVNAVLDWTMSTSGCTARGFSSELIMQGCMKATFSPASNKLVCAEIIFDTGGVQAQIKAMQQEITTPKINTAACSTGTDALIDSVGIPEVAPLQTNNCASTSGNSTLPSTVSVVSADTPSSDEDAPLNNIKIEQQ